MALAQLGRQGVRALMLCHDLANGTRTDRPSPGSSVVDGLRGLQKRTVEMRISLVTPLYRSAPYIEELYARAVAAITKITPDYEIVFVHDASPDNSLKVAKHLADQDPNVVVIDLSRNFGQHRALITGIRAATGDLIYICDSDLEEEPEWINLFYDRLAGSGCDVAFGVMSKKKGSFAYRLIRRFFYLLLHALSDATIPENVTTARLMTRNYVNAFLRYRETEVFLIGIWHMVGFSQVAIPVEKHDTSSTTYTFGRLANLFINGITSFSVRPLVLIALCGLLLVGASGIVVLWVLFNFLIYGAAVPGYTSVMLVTTTMAGLTILLNGIIAIYISKIYLEVKGRPLTIVKEVYTGRASRSSRVDAPAAKGPHVEAGTGEAT